MHRCRHVLGSPDSRLTVWGLRSRWQSAGHHAIGGFGRKSACGGHWHADAKLKTVGRSNNIDFVRATDELQWKCYYPHRFHRNRPCAGPAEAALGVSIDEQDPHTSVSVRRFDRPERWDGAGRGDHQCPGDCRQRPGDRVGHDHRARRQDRLRHRRRGADAGAAHHRRQGHERDAGLHRRPQAREQLRDAAADEVAARGGLHHGPRRRRAGRRQHRAARPHRQGRVRRPAHHRLGPGQSPADAGGSACRGSGAGRQGRQAHR